MTTGAVWAIGLGQCVNWGVLYYAFSVLIVPVERDLGVARWVVAGAFSAALLVSALVAPAVGSLVDRGHGPAVLQAGGLTAAALLALWAWAPSVWLSYVVWIALGVCMSAVLYEPVFAIVGKAIGHAHDRLRAIATITVFGGFASTLFLPATAALVNSFGWRRAVLVLATGLAATTLVVQRVTFGSGPANSRHEMPPRFTVPPGASAFASATADKSAGKQEVPSRLITVFTASSFASAALAINLVPALIERGLAATTAAAFAGLFGVMQLPGRVLFMNRERSVSPIVMLAFSLGLQTAGLAALAASHTFAAVAIGVTLFASGSGLATLARPYLVLALYGPERAGQINGRFARAQHLARAAGPVSAAAMAGVFGYGVVFATLAALLATVALFLATPSGRSK